MWTSAIILETLERVSELCADPTDRIYDHLFSVHPDMQALFIMDTDGGVRGSMVQTSLECIIDFVGPRRTAPLILSAARSDHDGYGVPSEIFADFFTAIRDAFRDILAEEWTSQRDVAWSHLLADLREVK